MPSHHASRVVKAEKQLKPRKYDLPSLEVGDALISQASDQPHGKKIQRAFMSAIHWHRKDFPKFNAATRIFVDPDDQLLKVGLWRLDDRMFAVVPNKRRAAI